jgi:hypothetical protein
MRVSGGAASPFFAGRPKFWSMARVHWGAVSFRLLTKGFSP